MKRLKLFLLVLFCLIITGCGSNETKEVGTLENFESVAINHGFMVNDNIGNYSNVSYINGSRVATINDATVEMVVYENDDYASQAQEKQIKSFMNIKSTGAVADKNKGKNFYSFSMISNGYYMVSSRIDNTLIFSKVLLENKENVETLIKDMNY